MFSQKKSFFRGKSFYLILAGVLAFGIWINKDMSGETNQADAGDKSGVKVVADSKKDQQKKSEDQGTSDLKNATGQPASGRYPSGEGTDADQDYSNPDAMGMTTPSSVEDRGSAGTDSAEPYYLLKEVNGIIQIFYYDEQGNEDLVRTTDITFSLLGESDQKLFSQGIIKHSEDELNEILQDFES